MPYSQETSYSRKKLLTETESMPGSTIDVISLKLQETDQSHSN